MSAYVVSAEHISVIIQAGIGRNIQAGTYREQTRWLADPTDFSQASASNGMSGAPGVTHLSRLRTLTLESADTVGQILVDANVLGAFVESNRHETAPSYYYTIPAGQREPVEIIKAIHALDYQSCESPEWRDCEAKRILNAIMDASINQLPGMKEAAWSIGVNSKTLADLRAASHPRTLEPARR